MDKKYSINEIAENLSEKTGKQTIDIEKFLKEFAIIVNEGITKDNYVKIKGIGIFKVVLVNERESIHVNTGERFVIPSHHKVSFMPENKLKNLINRPFAAFETIEAQEDETGHITLVKEIEEIGETGETEEIEEIEEIEEKPLIPPAIPLIEEKPPSPLPYPPIEQKPASLIPQIEEKALPSPLSQQRYMKQQQLRSSTTASSSLQSAKQNRKRKRKSKKSSMMFLYIILFFLLFVLIGGGIWYFLFYSNKNLDEYNSKLSSRMTGKDEIVSPVDSVLSDKIIEEAPLASDTVDSVQSRVDTPNAIVSQPDSSPPATAP